MISHNYPLQQGLIRLAILAFISAFTIIVSVPKSVAIPIGKVLNQVGHNLVDEFLPDKGTQVTADVKEDANQEIADADTYSNPNTPPTSSYPNQPPSYQYPNQPPSYQYPNQPPSYQYPNQPPSYQYPNQPPSYQYPNQPPSYQYPNQPPSYQYPNQPPSFFPFPFFQMPRSSPPVIINNF